MPDIHGIGSGNIQPAHIDTERSGKEGEQAPESASRKRPKSSSEALNGLPPKQESNARKTPSIHVAHSSARTPASGMQATASARTVLGKRSSESANHTEPPASKQARTTSGGENTPPASSTLPFGKKATSSKPEPSAPPFVFTAQRPQDSTPTPAVTGNKRTSETATMGNAGKRQRTDGPSATPSQPFAVHTNTPTETAQHTPPSNTTATNPRDSHHTPVSTGEHNASPAMAPKTADDKQTSPGNAEHDPTSVIKQLKELTTQTNEMQLASAQMNLSNQLTSALVNQYKTQGSSIKNATTPG